MPAAINLGRLVLDKGILDVDGARCGKVDDLVLEWGDTYPQPGPVVRSVIAGPMALTREWSRPIPKLASLVYALLGLPDAHPVEVPWNLIRIIDVVVHLSVRREEIGLDQPSSAVSEHIIGRLPGA